MWAQAQFDHWMQTRGDDPTLWRIEDCRAADKFLEAQDMAFVGQVLELKVRDAAIRQFVLDMVRLHYGSVEVDKFVRALSK